MKYRTVMLAQHQASGATTLAQCWKVTRVDGEVFAFTSCDIDLVFEDLRYEAATGFTPSAMQQNADLSVPNLEVNGFLDSSSITEDDLLAGYWDGAAVEIFEVNYRDLSMGRMILRTGTLGNVSAGKVAFQAELRGLTQKLQQPVGEVYAAACSANLGDDRCKVDIEALRVSLTVTTAASRRAFTAVAAVQADDWFGGGVASWLTGANAGISMEVRSFASTAFQLALPLPHAVAIGDTFTAVPGCRKRRTQDCGPKFSNVINHRGYPDVPGNDTVLGIAGLNT